MKKKAEKKSAKKSVAKKNVVEKSVFRPLHDNVVIEKDTANTEDKVTKGGLFIPGSATQPPNTAKVIAVGPAVEGLKANDVIVVGTFSGTKVVVNDEEYVVIKFDDVLGLYE